MTAIKIDAVESNFRPNAIRDFQCAQWQRSGEAFYTRPQQPERIDAEECHVSGLWTLQWYSGHVGGLLENKILNLLNECRHEKNNLFFQLFMTIVPDPSSTEASRMLYQCEEHSSNHHGVP